MRLSLVVVESGVVSSSSIRGARQMRLLPSLPADRLGRGDSGTGSRTTRARTDRLDVAIAERLVDFEQEGTPYGTAAMTGFVARIEGGELREGDEGPPAVYALDDLPGIIPVRAANQRVLEVYLSRRR
jgi:hypothetical protein